MAMENRGDNRWRFRVTKDGTPYTANFYGNEREAKKAHDAFRVDVERGQVNHGKSMKFGDYSNLFYKQHMEPHYSPVTIQSTIMQLETKILPELGHMKLDKIRTMHLNTFYIKLLKNLAPSSIKTIHATLSSMFSRAIEWEFLEKNPCANAMVPKQQKKKIEVYNYDELDQLFVVLETCTLKIKVIILLALGCMMRRGEICALTKNDINFEKRIISVNKAAKQINGVGTVVGSPKTPGSFRDIPIPQFVIDALHEYMNWLSSTGNVKNTEGYLFPSVSGNAMSPVRASTLCSCFFKDNGLRKITLHDLRHTGATLLIYNGVNLQTIANTLGHSNTAITSEVYLHQIENADHIAAIAMDNAIKRIGRK